LSAYEQFWRRYIPQHDKWDNPEDPLREPNPLLTQQVCDNYRACYPSKTKPQSCKRELVLTGICEEGVQKYGTCPIYFLYNWRWIKSHLAEVGPVTSSILVRPDLFTYSNGVYSSSSNIESEIRSEIIGMLDVTIIGWGQTKTNLRKDPINNTDCGQRWWYVIPHLGTDFGLTCSELLGDMKPADEDDVYDTYDNKDDPLLNFYSLTNKGDFYNYSTESYDGIQFQFMNVKCSLTSNEHTGVMQFSRRFDDSAIESQAVGAVPYNFVPRPWRTARPTWQYYTVPPNDSMW